MFFLLKKMLFGFHSPLNLGQLLLWAVLLSLSFEKYYFVLCIVLDSY